MRPGQNKRMRGRPTNNRRGPNPLTRSYELNGPDVKIRGNAHHVAEKYLQLARDAHTGGDPVAAENYLQHAEHYFRLIAAAQAAQALTQSGQPRSAGEGEGDELDDEGDFGALSDRFASPSERVAAPYQQPQQGFQPQPSIAPNGRSTPREFPTRASVRAPTTAPGLPIGRTGKATAFPTAARDRTGPSPSGLKATGTTGTAAMVVRGISARTAIPPPKPTREGGADVAASSGLPPFITASPRPTNADPTQDAPSPDAVASPAPTETPEAGPAVFEQPPGESGFPARARRRRLRSPYGFSRGDSGESGEPNSTPEITDDSPVTE